MLRIAIALLLAFGLSIPDFTSAQAGTVYARGVLENISDPAGIDNPPCNPVEQSRNVGQRLEQMGVDAVGKAVSSVPGLGGTDPFNTRRTNQSVCKDLCVVIPTGANFTARGSVTGTDASGAWEGDLPAGLPKSLEVAGWAAVEGPAVDTKANGDTVCYTYKNWSHTTTRRVGLEVNY